MQLSGPANLEPLEISVKYALVFPRAGAFYKGGLSLGNIPLKLRFYRFKKEQKA